MTGRFSVAVITVYYLAFVFTSKGYAEVTTPADSHLGGERPEDRRKTGGRDLGGVPQATGFQTSTGAEKWHTKAWIAVDEEAFYIAFDCDSPPDTPPLVNKKDGLPVWLEESVELRIAPWGAPDKQSIYQFVVNASGEKTFLKAQEKVPGKLWTASATARPGGWSAEMRIPLAMFKDRGRNEAAWRILFGRNSKTADHSSSFPKYNRWFANAWDYARLVPTPGRPSFLTLRGMLQPLASPGGPDGSQPLTEAADVAGPPLIIPQPVSARFTGDRFPLTRQTAIMLGTNATKSTPGRVKYWPTGSRRSAASGRRSSAWVTAHRRRAQEAV
jgi:hypothetical protein